MQVLKKIQRPHNALAYYAYIAGLYALLTLILPANHVTQSQYHLGSLQYHILILLVIVPVMGIWFLAFYGYAKLREYAALITGTREGPAFSYAADGMMWLAWGLPIPSFVSLVVNTIANSHPGFNSAAIIITNYANIIIPVVAFSLLATGSRMLLEREKLRISILATKLLVASFVTLGAFYCFFVFRNIGSLHDNTANNPYYLPDWLLLITIVIPYLYSWFVGLLAAYEVRLVSRHSDGLLYKRALELLSLGLTVTVGSSIALQYIRSLIPRTSHLSLGYAFLLVYVILAVIGVGYGLMALGTKKLKRFEEV